MKLLQIIRTFFIAVVLPSLSLAQTPVFENPIAEKRADPWIYKNDDGTYFLIATVPAYDRIVLRTNGSYMKNSWFIKSAPGDVYNVSVKHHIRIGACIATEVKNYFIRKASYAES